MWLCLTHFAWPLLTLNFAIALHCVFTCDSVWLTLYGRCCTLNFAIALHCVFTCDSVWLTLYGRCLHRTLSQSLPVQIALHLTHFERLVITSNFTVIAYLSITVSYLLWTTGAHIELCHLVTASLNVTVSDSLYMTVAVHSLSPSHCLFKCRCVWLTLYDCCCPLNFVT